MTCLHHRFREFFLREAYRPTKAPAAPAPRAMPPSTRNGSRHAISATWGRSDLASSDMMSLETRRRVWQARLDPRRQTPSVGIYTYVRDRWGIFYAQPIVLNERQVGAAI